MTKIPTLYSDYKECMLDLDIYGKIVATPQQSLEDLEKTLFEEFQRRKPMPTLEYKRYELSRLVNPDYRIAYNKELELQDNERLLDLQSDLEASYENIDFEDLSSLVPTAKELFSYENHITDSMRNDIISKYDLKTGELFEPGIAQTENIVGSVEEDENTVLTEEKIANLGVDEEEEVSMADDPMEVIAYNDREQSETTYEVDDDEVTYEVEDEDSSETYEDSEEDFEDDYSNEDSEESDEDDYSDYDSDSEEDEDSEDDSDEDIEDTEESDDEDDYDSYDDTDEDDYGSYDLDDEDSEDGVVSDDDSEDGYEDSSDEGEDDYDSYDSDEDSEDDYDNYDSDDEVSEDSGDDSEDEDDYDSYDLDDDTSEQEVDIGKLRGSPNKSDIDFDDISDSFMDSVLDEPKIDTSEHIINKSVETPVTPAQIHNNVPVSEVIDRSAEPTDIRAFLRKHPRCDYDFALKYFTKKQINDAIKIGKIIKKGNILKI